MPRSCCHIKRFGLLDLHRVQTMLKIQFRIHTYLQTFGPKFGILDLFPAHRCPKISNLGSACGKDIGRDIQRSLHSTHLFVLSDKPFYHVVFSLKLCRCCFCSKKWHHLWCPSSGHARGGCRIWYMMRGSISLIMSCMLMHICCRSKGAHCRHGWLFLWPRKGICIHSVSKFSWVSWVAVPVRRSVSSPWMMLWTWSWRYIVWWSRNMVVTGWGLQFQVMSSQVGHSVRSNG